MKLHTVKVIEWYDYPVVFIASNESGNQKFLCVFYKEEKNSIHYIVSPLSSTELIKLMFNYLDLRTHFLTKLPFLYECILKDDENSFFEIKRIKNISLDILPAENIFIGTLPKIEDYEIKVQNKKLANNDKYSVSEDLMMDIA